MSRMPRLCQECQENRADWDQKLGNIQYVMNDMKNKTTGQISYNLLMNYHPRNGVQNHLIAALQDVEEDEPKDVIRQREKALNKIKASQSQQKKRFDKRHKKPKKYKQDDLVLVLREAAATGQSRKLTPNYKGPYQVSEVLPHDRHRQY